MAVILISHASTAQTYDEAIGLIKVNQYKDAVEILRKLQKDPKEMSNASLALAVVESSVESYQQAFADFKLFFDNSPDPYPYIYPLYHSGVFSDIDLKDKSNVSKFLEQILEDPKANCTIKACAIDRLARKLMQQGDFDGQRKICSGLNDVKNWSTAGVFENFSGSGFNKDFGVLAHPEAGYVFKNNINAEVQWFEIPNVRNDRWWDLTNNFFISNAIIYAQTFINSDEDKDVLLMIGVSGSLKAWVNDFQVANVSEERNTSEDVYTYRVKLQKGYNRVLLQLGSSEIKRNNFMVRIADLNGVLQTNIASVSSLQPYPKAQPYEVKQMPFFVEKYFEELVAKDPGNFINQVLLLLVYSRNEKKYEAHSVLAKLKKMAPVSTLVSQKAISIAQIDNNVVDETREKESIKTNDPESLPGTMLRYHDAVTKENWEQAISLLRKHDSLFGGTANTKLEFLGILGKQKKIEELGTEVNLAYQKYPDNEKIVETKYLMDFSRNKDYKSALPILTKYEENNFSENIFETVVEIYLKTGAKKDAIELLKAQIQNNPIYLKSYSQLVNIYYDTHQFDEALSTLRTTLQMSPYNGRYYYMQGLVYAAKGDPANAIKSMKKAIYYSPTNYDAREKLRTLQNEKKLFDYFKPNDAVKVYSDALTNDKYAKEEAVVLINDKRQIVYPENGAVEEQQELLVYINSQTAIQNYKEINIPYNRFTQRLIIETAELLKKDGSKVRAEKQNGYCVFSSLGIGDAVHLSYRLQNSYEGKLAEHFWSEMYFSNVYPTQTARYSLIVPADKKFDYKLTNIDRRPKIDFLGEYTMYSWEENDLAKTVPEPLIKTSVLEKVTVSSIPDWSYVANWYSDLSNTMTAPEFEVKEKVKELMTGNEGKSEFDKARIIYNYIENNYAYSNVAFLHSAFTPQRASRTLSTKLGDCKDLSTLFVSMAKEAGLNANLVLVRTNSSGDDNLELPSIGFNHCIAQLHTAGKNYLVELTDNNLPFTAMGMSTINANGLTIPNDGRSVNNAALVKLNTPDRPANSSVRTSKISFGDDKATVHRVVYKTGYETSGLRRFYKDLDDEEMVKKLTTSVNTDFNKNIKIENFKVRNLKNLDDTLFFEYDVKVDNFSTEIAGMTVFRIPWTNARVNEQFFSLEKRKYPMDFQLFTSSPIATETISIELPAGKKLVETPKNVTIKDSTLTYSITYSLKGNQLTAERKITFLKDMIMPNEYEAVRNEIAKINQADTKDIAFK